MMQNLVLVLDEEVSVHGFIKLGLEQIYGEEIEIRIEEPLNNKEDMIKHIQENSERLAALIFDERLNETGIANYIGSELAEAYRSFDTKIPIYILTSYPDSVDENSGDIEYVIDKEDVLETESFEELSQKLRRHVNIFQDMVDERKKMLDELLVTQLDSTLTDEQKKQLKELQFWRTRPVELEESLLADELRNSLDEKEKILDELEAQLNKEN